MKIRLAAYLQPDSIVDGDGIRTVIWTQGCKHKCPKCHNPETHDMNGGALIDIEDIKKEMEKLKINVEETAKNYSKLEGEYKKAIIDRDNLSSQLIRRNDEVSILHEKIMILTTDMSKSEKTVQEKEDIIKSNNRNLENLKRELAINTKFREK